MRGRGIEEDRVKNTVIGIYTSDSEKEGEEERRIVRDKREN